MDLSFESGLAEQYTSQSQKIRILSEDWVGKQIYCPNCGHLDIEQYSNNKPVADFFCENCKEEYELKSKQNSIGAKIVDGAYKTMIERLQEINNPNFFLLNYDLGTLKVLNFLVIPKHFFVPGIIEKRKPLALTARRAGWIGCNIVLKDIPQSGKIFFIKNGISEPKHRVLSEWKKTLFLRKEKKIEARGWLLDTMKCLEKLNRPEFSLNDVYAFEKELSKKYPDNHHIKDKIRQQLQILRDKGYLKFTTRGCYQLS